MCPVCRHFTHCGGCALQHLERTAYLAWKREQVTAAFAARGIDVPVAPVISVGLGARRRATFSARRTGRGVVLGFYEAKGHDIVDLHECPVTASAIVEAAYAIDRANKQGFAGGLAHRDAIAALQLRLFTSEPAYPRAEAAPYVLGVGSPGLIRFTYYSAMAQLWQATKGNEREFAGYYGPEARLNLLIGVERGWPGARAAYDYLWPFIAVQPASGGVPDLERRAGWAVNLQ